MQADLKSRIKELSALINTYAKDKKTTSLLEVASSLANYFDAQTVTFWRVDDRNKVIKRIDTDEDIEISIDGSFTQHLLSSKKILIENHITSNKFYNQEIDNPLDLKIKSLMVLPIMEGKAVVAMVKIWRGFKTRKKFVKADEDALNALSPILHTMCKKEEISKKDLLNLIGSSEENGTETVKKVTISKKPDTKKPNIEKRNEDKEILVKLEREISALREENKTFTEKEKIQKEKSEAYEKSIKTLTSSEKKLKEKIEEKDNTLLELKSKLETLESKNKENELLLQSTIDARDKELSKYKDKYQKLEASSLKFNSKSVEYQGAIEDLQKDLKALQQENTELIEDLKEKSASSNIKELKSEKSISYYGKSEDIECNIETIWKNKDSNFLENEHFYILFELMAYATSSKKGVSSVEEELGQSKLLQKLIESYYFQGDVQVQNEKYLISDLLKNIEDYRKNIFKETINFNIIVDDKMPSSLVLDAFKIKSIILHLLMDLHHFSDHSKNIDIRLSFIDKLFGIEMRASIHRDNSIFKNMFKQSKLIDNEKGRIGLQFSKKIISRIRGEINTVYEDSYCMFRVKVPSQIIKM